MNRRGFATALKDEGADAADTREAGQWENIKFVLRYIRDDPARAKRIIARL